MKKTTILIATLAISASSHSARAAFTSFTPTSVLMPVKSITLSGTSGSTSTIYTCEGATEADCMIDLADTSAMAAKFANSLEVEPGTYDKVEFTTCDVNAGNSYHIKLKGTVGGYATSASDSLVAGTAAEYVTIPLSHCGGKSTTLPSPLEIKKGSEVNLTLFVSTKMMAWATTASDTTTGMDCFTSGAKSVCISYPDTVAYIGTASPTAETYHIAFNSDDPSQAGGQVLLIKDASDAILGALSRKLYLPGTITGGCEMGFPMNKISAVSTNVLDLASMDPAGPTLLRFPAFERTSTHTGTATCRFDATSPYSAHRQ